MIDHTDNRPAWSSYFLDIAEVVATRSTCSRLAVGAVAISKDRNILATGYNGAPIGSPHCDQEGHDLDKDNHCTRAVHAESNVVASAARHGVSLNGAKLFCTHAPCWPCARLLLNAGISQVVFKNVYKLDSRIVSAGLNIVHLGEMPNSYNLEITNGSVSNDKAWFVRDGNDKYIANGHSKSVAQARIDASFEAWDIFSRKG